MKDFFKRLRDAAQRIVPQSKTSDTTVAANDCFVVLNGNGMVMTSEDNQQWRYDNQLLRLAHKKRITELARNGNTFTAKDALGNVYHKTIGDKWKKAS